MTLKGLSGRNRAHEDPDPASQLSSWGLRHSGVWRGQSHVEEVEQLRVALVTEGGRLGPHVHTLHPLPSRQVCAAHRCWARPAPQTSDRATLRHGGLCPEGLSQSQRKLEPDDRQEPALRLNHCGLTARAA